MTEKKPKETDPEQSEKFRKAVRDLEAAGELSPTDDDDFEGAITKIVPPNTR
jgi:hypothetical protein